MDSHKSYTVNKFFNRWCLTGIISVLLLANVFIILVVNNINNKETVSLLIRSTAKLSFLLFMLAFVASSLHYYVKNSLTSWLLQNRRYIGVSFAISHYIHLGMLFIMTFYISFNVFEDRGLAKTIVGIIAYVFITLMTLTSFDKTRNLFGSKNWKRIHTIGGYLLWIIFAKSFILQMTNPLRVIFLLIAITVLLLRISVLFKRKGQRL